VHEFLTASVDETIALGTRLGALLEAGDFVALEGPLGAGKTRIAEGIARGLGVDPAQRIPSPTFTLVNEHEGRLTLLHVDLYRLESADELEGLGWRDYLERPAVMVVEWLSVVGPEHAPADRIDITMAPIAIEGDRRRVVMSATGPRSAARLHALR
jgi:tRNA threonylcarbamoyladenosine biosynthesis protein TsaE